MIIDLITGRRRREASCVNRDRRDSDTQQRSYTLSGAHRPPSQVWQFAFLMPYRLETNRDVLIGGLIKFSITYLKSG
jgi:hypothetical protein